VSIKKEKGEKDWIIIFLLLSKTGNDSKKFAFECAKRT